MIEPERNWAHAINQFAKYHLIIVKWLISYTAKFFEVYIVKMDNITYCSYMVVLKW